MAGAGGYEEQLEELRALRQRIDFQELIFAMRAAEFAELPEFLDEHADSAIGVLRDQCRMTSRAAAQAITIGEQVDHLPLSAESLQEGGIGLAHLGLIAYTTKSLRESPTARGFDEFPLLVRAQKLTVKGLMRACSSYRHAMDPTAFEAEERRGVEDRFLQMVSLDEGGMYLKGWLDNEGAATLRAALDPLAQKEGPGDDRLLDRRNADALVELAGGARPAQIQVSATLESLARAAGCPAVEIEHGAPMSAAALGRLACDCSLVRVLLDADSQVIDVGRARRTVAGPQRRALVHRDRTCRWPGCLRPARRCAAHHLQHWGQGGETNLGNLISLCGRHHWLVHEGGWALRGTIGDGFVAVPPRPSWWTDLPAA